MRISGLRLVAERPPNALKPPPAPTHNLSLLAPRVRENPTHFVLLFYELPFLPRHRVLL